MNRFCISYWTPANSVFHRAVVLASSIPSQEIRRSYSYGAEARRVKKASLYFLVLAIFFLFSCDGGPKCNNPGVRYFCTVPPPTDSTLSKVGGRVALKSSTGDTNWCASQGTNVQTQCMNDCTSGKFGSPIDCSSVVAKTSVLTEYVVWDSDLSKGINKCSQGQIVGPGTFGINPTSHMADTQYSCLYIHDPAPCCLDVRSSSSSLSVGPASFDNYIASVVPGSSAMVQSDEDKNKNGLVAAVPGDRSFSFDIYSGLMHISSLTVLLQNFDFQGQSFTRGSAMIRNLPVTATVDPSDSSKFVVPPGKATFGLTALDKNAQAYSLTTTNSVPIVISLAGAYGPHIAGRLSGSINGHSVHADIDASLIWINRPPVAIAKAANVTFNSALWPDAKDNTQSCMTPKGPKIWTWHGVLGAKVPVLVDGSSSFDPNGDRLVYAWNLVALGSQPAGYLMLGPGRYTAILTVQNTYYVSSINTVQFEVRDIANPGFPSDCGQLMKVEYDLSQIHRHLDPGDPFWLRTVILDYAKSEGTGVVLNAYSREKVLQLSEDLGQGVGSAVLDMASKQGLGALGSMEKRAATERTTSIWLVIALVLGLLATALASVSLFRRRR